MAAANDLHSPLVDKVVIAQESLGGLLNSLLPGSFRDITRIDLAALDNVAIKTVGLYGSKSEIVHFFQEMGAVDENT